MKKNIIKNVVSLYGFSIAKMVFPLITLPYLTRVLSTDTYGVVAYVKSVMTYFQILIDFGFLLSGTRDIVMARSGLGHSKRKTKGQVNRVTSQIFFARLLIAALAFVILVPMVLFVPLLRENPWFAVLSFIPVFLTSFLFDYVFRGFEKMNVLTIQFVLMKSISTLFTFVFVHNDADIIWIPVLDIIASLAAVVLISVELKRMKIRIVFCSLISVLKKLWESAVYFASDVATTAFGVFITVMLGAFCTPAEVAYWSVCSTMVSAVQAIYNPIFNGIYPEMVKTKDFKIIAKTLLVFMPIVVAGCIFTFFVADYAVMIVGGKEYVSAGNLLRAFIPVLLFSFPAMLFGWPTLGAINKAKQVTITTVCAAVVQVAGLLILLAIGRFELIPIAFIRGLSELFLLSGRGFTAWKNRKLFKKTPPKIQTT